MKRLFFLISVAVLLISCVETPTDFNKSGGNEEDTNISFSKCKAIKKSLAGNFSGIAWLGGDDYAIVDDKSETEGFYRFKIEMDYRGEITSVERKEFVSSGEPAQDGESLDYYPDAQTIFIVEEGDNSVVELDLKDGHRTGREIECRDIFPVVFNAGLESLSYNAVTSRFWLTSETTLPDDGVTATPENGLSNKLRIQSYDKALKKAGQWFYRTDKPSIKVSGDPYVAGVSDICALDDGRLLVLERESNMVGFSGFCTNKIYLVDPSSTAEGCELEKSLLIELSSKSTNYANYEGMCLGPRIEDGRRVLVLVSDSQTNLRGALKDWFLTIRVRGI